MEIFVSSFPLSGDCVGGTESAGAGEESLPSSFPLCGGCGGGKESTCAGFSLVSPSSCLHVPFSCAGAGLNIPESVSAVLQAFLSLLDVAMLFAPLLTI